MAEAFVIATDADLRLAAEHTKVATAACKAIKAMFAPAKKALDDAKRQITSLESNLLSGFQRADTILRAKVTAYNTERQRKAREEQQRREAEERRIREDAILTQAAQLETLAVQTGDEHFRKAAEQTLNLPVRTPAIPIEVAKVPGITFREETGVLVADMDALIKAVAAGHVDRQALMANEKWLRNEAVQRGTAVKDGDLLYPGVLVTKTQDVSVRTR